MCLSTFLDFWISGAHEREITSSNLPLSEALCQSINSDGYRRDVSEEYSGERAGGGILHASRAGGTVVDI